MERLTAEDRLMLWPDERWPQEIGALRGRRVDRSRPLWEMWFLTGLPERRIGLLARPPPPGLPGPVPARDAYLARSWPGGGCSAAVVDSGVVACSGYPGNGTGGNGLCELGY